MKRLKEIWILCILMTPACSERQAEPGAVMVRDSAGVTIVENARPKWTADSGWTVIPEPLVTIGAVAGDDPYLLDRVGHARRLSDGRIVVVNGGTQEIRFYDADGRHLRSVGGRGDGPGEFQGPRSLFRIAGDSLFVADALAARFSVLDPDGAFVRSYGVGWGRASPLGRLSDGSLITLNYADPQLAVALGHVRVPLAVLRFTPDATREDTIAVLPGGEEFRVQVTGGIANYEAPFGRQQHVFVHHDRIYAGAGDSFEIEIRLAEGSVHQLIRADISTRTVERADVDVWRQGHLERATERSRPAVEMLLRDAPVPSTMPAYSEFHVDVDGNLWVRGYAPPNEAALLWQVFDSEGRWLGGLELPDRLQVTEIGEQYVLGIYRDEMDVEYVRLHRIDKNRHRNTQSSDV